MSICKLSHWVLRLSNKAATISDQVSTAGWTSNSPHGSTAPDARTIRHALGQLAAKGSISKESDEFLVEAEMEGTSAKELNRTLLSTLRKVEKRTTLRAEWTCGNTTEGFFDYVLKKTVKN
jgi:hypothetical protein